MPARPRFIELVPVDPDGLRDVGDLPAALPYGLQPRDFLRTVEDVHQLIHRLNTVLHEESYDRLESLLDPAGFSGLISRTVASRLAAASLALVVNAFHNGYPDLVREGQYPHNAVQHGEGLEVKASRSESNWQSHGPRGGWFTWVQFALDERDDVAAFDRQPTRIVAVMVAELGEGDWSWQPAREGRIRSGTASVLASGKAKLRAGAVWVDPAYEEEHLAQLAKVRADAFSRAADAMILAHLREIGEPATAGQLAELLHAAAEISEDVAKSRISSALLRLRRAGRVEPGDVRGSYRVTE